MSFELYLAGIRDLYLFRPPMGKQMELYLAGLHSEYNGRLGAFKVGASGVKVFLAGEYPWPETYPDIWHRVYMLGSFYYAAPWQVELLPRLKGFMLDSGAYTFMSKVSDFRTVNWDQYVDKYAAFIREHRIRRFFELDIDSLVGLSKVEELRQRLEDRVGQPSIPVWHKSRGKEKFLEMCEHYNYVAIGGIVAKEIKQNEHHFFPWFIKEAHNRGARIHGLGFTPTGFKKDYRFDSVDSTSWLYGSKGGYIYVFAEGQLRKINPPGGKRLRNKEAAQNNFVQWVRYAEFLEERSRG